MIWVVPDTTRAGNLGPTDSSGPGFAMPLSSPCCSQSPGSRWEEACGSTSLICMSPLAPRLGRGTLPACLMSFQEHMPTVPSLESCYRNWVLQATHTPTNTHRHTIHTCKHITIVHMVEHLSLQFAILTMQLWFLGYLFLDSSLVLSIFYILLLLLLFISHLPSHKVLRKKSRDCNDIKEGTDLNIYALIGQVLWVIIL